MQPECCVRVVACRVVNDLARTVSACVWLARYVNDHMLTRQGWLRAILARNHSLNRKAISLQACPTCQCCVMRLQRLSNWAVEFLENPFNQCHWPHSWENVFLDFLLQTLCQVQSCVNQRYVTPPRLQYPPNLGSSFIVVQKMLHHPDTDYYIEGFRCVGKTLCYRNSALCVGALLGFLQCKV